jgi:FkbM family methyltransferase
MTRKVIIDCGAFNGCSILKFNQIINDFANHDVFCFEILPKYHQNLCNMQSIMNNVSYINKGVWIKNDTLPFFLSTITDDGNSLLETKTSNNIDKQNPINVEVIDFSEWLLKNFNINDEIILKMDIEGAEYAVLEKMIRDESIKLISKLYIEWHYEKISNISEKTHHALITMLQKNNIQIHDWDSLEYKPQADMIFSS